LSAIALYPEVLLAVERVRLLRVERKTFALPETINVPKDGSAAGPDVRPAADFGGA
jgi:hypothetical protein